MWLAAGPAEGRIGSASAARPNNWGWNRPSGHRTGQDRLPGIRKPQNKRPCTPDFTCHAESAGGQAARGPCAG